MRSNKRGISPPIFLEEKNRKEYEIPALGSIKTKKHKWQEMMECFREIQG